MTAPIRWNLSPTDSRIVAALRYLPTAFFGGYLLLGVALALFALPELLSNPPILALVVLLALVGGPVSLLYLWPMIRDPEQRPDPGDFAWFADLQPARLVAAAIGGAVLVGTGLVLFGAWAQLVLVLGCLFVPAVVVAAFDADGEVDTQAETLTYREQTVDIDILNSVITWRLGSVRVFVLRYRARVGGGWKPRVLLVPKRVGDSVETALRQGVAADPDRQPREPDRTAQLLLGTVGLAFLATAAAIFALTDVPTGIRGYVAAITAGIGLLFVLGVRYIA